MTPEANSSDNNTSHDSLKSGEQITYRDQVLIVRGSLQGNNQLIPFTTYFSNIYSLKKSKLFQVLLDSKNVCKVAL